MDRRTNGKEFSLREILNSYANSITVSTDICRQPGLAGFGQRKDALLYKHNA